MSKKSKGMPPAVIPLRRPYRETVLAFLLFGGAAVFFYFQATRNVRGLILNGIITMDPDMANWFYGVLGVLSAGMSAMGAWAAFRITQVENWFIDLRETEMTFPAGPPFRSPVVTVPYDRITSVGIAGQGNIQSFVIREDDRAYSIPSKWIAEDWTVQRVSDEVISRVRAANDKQAARRKQ